MSFPLKPDSLTSAFVPPEDARHTHIWRPDPLGHGTKSCDCGQTVPRSEHEDPAEEARLSAAEEGFRNGCEYVLQTVRELEHQRRAGARELEQEADTLARAAASIVGCTIGKGRGG